MTNQNTFHWSSSEWHSTTHSSPFRKNTVQCTPCVRTSGIKVIRFSQGDASSNWHVDGHVQSCQEGQLKSCVPFWGGWAITVHQTGWISYYCLQSIISPHIVGIPDNPSRNVFPMHQLWNRESSSCRLSLVRNVIFSDNHGIQLIPSDLWKIRNARMDAWSQLVKELRTEWMINKRSVTPVNSTWGWPIINMFATFPLLACPLHGLRPMVSAEVPDKPSLALGTISRYFAQILIFLLNISPGLVWRLIQYRGATLYYIGIPIVEIRRSHDRLISTVGVFVPWFLTWYKCICSKLQSVLSTSSTHLSQYCLLGIYINGKRGSTAQARGSVK